MRKNLTKPSEHPFGSRFPLQTQRASGAATSKYGHLTPNPSVEPTPETEEFSSCLVMGAAHLCVRAHERPLVNRAHEAEPNAHADMQRKVPAIERSSKPECYIQTGNKRQENGVYRRQHARRETALYPGVHPRPADKCFVLLFLVFHTFF